MNVVYYGDFVILCPNYTWGKNKLVPGNGGVEYHINTKHAFLYSIIVKIKVTSTEFPISIINNNYVVILSKTKYTPKIVDTEKIYLNKIFLKKNPAYPNINFDYVVDSPYYKNLLFEAVNEIVEISDIYDNTAYTIAKICNKLAEINRTFSFDIISGTSFTFYFSFNYRAHYGNKYIPMLFTKNKKYKNMFTVDYFDKYFNYYPRKFNGEDHNTFAQTIDFTTTADTATISVLDYETSKLVRNCVFSPLESPYKIYCPATDDLPQTFVGKSVKVDCPTGGNKEYKCENEGLWKKIYNNCACEAADNFTRTIAGETATKNCPSGYTGSITRKCSESGVWEDEVNSCTYKYINIIYIILIIIVVIVVIIIIIIIIRRNHKVKKELIDFN